MQSLFIIESNAFPMTFLVANALTKDYLFIEPYFIIEFASSKIFFLQKILIQYRNALTK